MSLLLKRATISRNVLSRLCSTKITEPNSDEEFREIQLFPKRAEGRKTMKKTQKFEVSQPRCDKMPVDQHWPSVWPVAASFKPSVVPLPLRQGFPMRGEPSPDKFANLELMKIPNFLHLTPPAVKAHCEALKKFCSKWPENLTDETSKDWCTISTSDYIHAGPSIFDDRARVVTVKLKLSALKLDEHAREKFIQLVGARYNKNTDEVVIVTDRCPMRHQNLDYTMYVLTALYHESYITEDWELTERQEADQFEFRFADSRSEKYAKEFAAKSKGVSETCIEKYGEALTNLKNQGDSDYNLKAYKKAALALMNLKPREQPEITAQ